MSLILTPGTIHLILKQTDPIPFYLNMSKITNKKNTRSIGLTNKNTLMIRKK